MLKTLRTCSLAGLALAASSLALAEEPASAPPVGAAPAATTDASAAPAAAPAPAATPAPAAAPTGADQAREALLRAIIRASAKVANSPTGVRDLAEAYALLERDLVPRTGVVHNKT